ncbi:MAG: hypothetical protein IJN81_05055, partial [Clostridia bacterium]|nr:hypothetical protein [Clostridia bacterium]
MIYPVPQNNNLNGNVVNVSSLSLKGEYTALAERILADYGVSVTGGLAVEITVSDSRKTTYIESLSRLSREKYFITVTDDKITVEASCRSGVFRALHT